MSNELSMAYEKLRSSSLVFISAPSTEGKIKGIYLSKEACNIKLEKDEDSGKCILSYSLSVEGQTGFSITQIHEERLPDDSKIVLTIPKFNLFVTGDLAYYADMLGMPNSSSYWCPWCLLSRPEWQGSPDATGEIRTTKSLLDIYDAIRNDGDKRLKPMDKKGVSTEMHYKNLGPEHFVPPLLHMEMGSVNTTWEDFEQWVDDTVEIVPPYEKDARIALIISKKNFRLQFRTKK